MVFFARLKKNELLYSRKSNWKKIPSPPVQNLEFVKVSGNVRSFGIIYLFSIMYLVFLLAR